MNVKRTSARLLLIIVAGAGFMSMAPSGGCGGKDYSLVTDLRIDHDADTWQRFDIPTNASHGWNQTELNPVSGSAGSNTSTLRVTGLQPRELFAFSLNTNRRDHPGVFRDSYQFVSAVPGAAKTAPFHVNAARLIDHGGCRITVPFGTPESGLFANIQSAVAQGFIGALRDQGAGDPREDYSYIQARFVHQTGDPSDNLLDGFMIYGQYRGDAPILVEDPVLRFWWGYQFYLDKGFPAVKANASRYSVQVPGPVDVGDVVRLVREGLNVTLPTKLREKVLFGDETPGAAPGVAVVLGGGCSPDLDPNPDDTCDTPGNRIFLAGLIKVGSETGPSPLTFAEAKVIADGQSHQDFFCRATTGACFWRPTFRRLAVRPDGVEAIFNNADEGPTPEYHALHNLSPNTPISCTLTQTPTTGSVTWISRGNVNPNWPTGF